LIARLKAEIKAELREELKVELREELKTKTGLLGIVRAVHELSRRIEDFCAAVHAASSAGALDTEGYARELRRLVRGTAGLAVDMLEVPDSGDLLAEFAFLRATADVLRPAFQALVSRRVLFCGQAYYNAWYLSRALRRLGWKADVYNWDANPTSQIYYHGEDFHLGADIPLTVEGELGFYLASLYGYDVVHFSKAHGIAFGWQTQAIVAEKFGAHEEIHLLKALGKKVVYSNNGCLDGCGRRNRALRR